MAGIVLQHPARAGAGNDAAHAGAGGVMDCQAGSLLARKGNGPPGPHVLWRGFRHLPYITDELLVMRRNE